MRLIALSFSLICSYSIFGQAIPPGSVSGKILDEDQHPVPFANVVLLHDQDSSLSKAAITEDNGEFVFEGIKPGSYFLSATFAGYKKFSGSVFTMSESNYNSGIITLQKQSTELKEVSVMAIKPFVEHQFDKTIVNVENSIVNAGSTAMEVLQRSPGVIVDQNENILLKGKAGTVVMIDGKPSPLSGEALASMLKGMPSGAISKIEIITNPSAKYDAAGSAGIINLVLKRDKRMGTNGNISASEGQGRYSKTSAGFGLNYRNVKWTMFLNYNYAHRKGFNQTSHIRNFYLNGTLSDVYSQDIYATIPSDAHVPRMGADYRISTNTTIGIQLNGMANFITPQANNTTFVSDENALPSGSFNTVSNSRNSWYNYGGNFNLRHKFDSLGREITADLDYSHYLNQNKQYFTTYSFDPGNNLLNEAILLGNQHGLLDIYAFKTDYTHPIKKIVKIEAGLKSSYVKTDNNLEYFNRIGNIDNSDTANSNHFIYSENINAGYINMNKEWEKFNLQSGLRVEQTLAKGVQLSNDSVFTRNYFQPFFSLAGNYKFNDKNEAGITVSRRISRPDYMQLNPFRRYVDKTTYGAGNPFLLPALTYSTDLSYTIRQSLTFTINYSNTRDAIETVFLQNDLNKVTIQTEVNIHKSEYYMFTVNYSKQLSQWFQTNTEFDIWRSKYSGYLSGANLDRSRPSFYFNSSNIFILPRNFSIELSGFYQYRQIAGMLDINDTWTAGVGVQKRIMKSKGVLKLNGTDLFWQNSSSGGAHFANVDSHFLSRHETQVATLAFAYNFGKNGAQVKKRSGSDDEKNRVKVGT